MLFITADKTHVGLLTKLWFVKRFLCACLQQSVEEGLTLLDSDPLESATSVLFMNDVPITKTSAFLAVRLTALFGFMHMHIVNKPEVSGGEPDEN